MIESFKRHFPEFANAIETRPEANLKNVLPPASDAEIEEIERRVGVPLPQRYKDLLRCARGFWLLDGAIQLHEGHPFRHEFPPLSDLPAENARAIAARGLPWPPPSQGMLCFAEFFLEADGDQVLWDLRSRSANGEYPILYYAHEDRPPALRKLANTFDAFLNSALSYFPFDE